MAPPKKRAPRAPVAAASRSLQKETAVAQTPIRRADVVDQPLSLQPAYSATQRLVMVAVPRMTTSTSEMPSSKASSARTSLGSFQGDSSRDSSMEYDTPATSAAPTPTESSLNGKRTFSSISTSVSNNKRRRVTMAVEGQDNDDALAGARLARALQEEEYNFEFKKPAKPSLPLRIREGLVDETDEEDDLSSVFSMESNVSYTPSDASDAFEDPAITKSRKVPMSLARGNVPTKSTLAGTAKSLLPGRTARASAEKAIADKLRSIADSDLSELSDMDSEDLFSVVDLVSDEEDDFSTDNDGSVVSVDDPLAATGAPSALTDARTRSLARRQLHARARRPIGRTERERWKLERAHPEIKTMWDSLRALPTIATERAEQPPSISRRLKPFQLEGLNWMRKQEQTQWKGGLLGDEMGMGKTIQAVSLIMSDYPQKQPTLVIVPPVALMQWSNEIQEYTDGKLKVLVFHGTNSKAKRLTVAELKKYDVIMISYNSLESLYRKETKGWSRDEVIVKEDSVMHAIHFHRLILDEAHSIKSRTTGVAKACFALKGTYKWCLSGTPVQNRIGEFFSLLRFLEVQPYANYFCKSCACSNIHWSFGKDHRCSHCKHRALEHVSVFNQEILNPITNSENEKDRKTAFGKLRLLTDRIMLRRMKRDHTASMELPPKEVVIHNEFFGEIERDFSSSIMSNTTRQFDTYVSRGVMLNNYANIFGLIMQMRQIANHPDLLLKKHSDGGQNVLVCNICDEPAEEAIKSKCKHEFCRACVKDYMRTCEASGASPDCPRCHIALAIDLDQPDIEQNEEDVKKSSIINRLQMANWTSSTKIEMLVYDLYKLRSKRQTLKSIVFSQFTSMLQLIEWRLRRAGFNTVMLDGSMTPAQRQKSIEYFMNNTDVEVFLVSLKAGGVALNLVEASRVFIVDPWWNPAAEWQSADRCHRIGQKRPCVITRLCIEDSVESRIVMLQEKKANMINGTINNDEVAMEKLTPEDMQFLFRGS